MIEEIQMSSPRCSLVDSHRLSTRCGSMLIESVMSDATQREKDIGRHFRRQAPV